MRPLRLEMEGFSAFRDRTVVDFADVDLAALWGPTGAGKSTLVDAVTFALFGSVARYDDDRLVAPVINQLSTEARVRLDFEVGGEQYSAVRVVQRTGRGASTRAAQLERGMEVVASSAGEMRPAVERLLGMDFAQFTKTVVLPQGDFAAFLHDRPAERQKLLRQLLDLGVYARMGEEARRRAAAATTRLEAITDLLAGRADVTDDQLAALQHRVGALTALRRQVVDDTRRLTDLAQQVQHLAEADTRMGRDLDRLGGLAMPPAVADLGAQLGQATAALAAATEAASAARNSGQAAERAVAEGPDRAACDRLLAAYAERDVCAGEVDEHAAASARAGATLDEARAAANVARTALDRADEALQAARAVAPAPALRTLLVVGEPCPVCQQTVHDLPAHDRDFERELAAAGERRKEAQAASRHHDEARAAASDAYARAEVALEAARRRMAQLDAALQGAPPPEALAADVARADSLAAARTAAVSALERAERAERDARAAVEELHAAERQQRRAFGAARDTVADLGPPPAAGESLHDDWVELVAWAATGTGRLGRERGENADLLATATAELEAERQAIVDRCRPYVATDRPERLAELVAEASTRAEADLEQARVQRDERDRLRSHVESLEAEAGVAAELGRLLQASGFERWLMGEAVGDLVDRATERLLELSGGRYSLVAAETELRVKDHRNADEVRDARTLSGGETFLASLSLALALADSIADLAPEGSAQLESIFLDEGFGTLDPDTLDVVASAIEELGAAGRMVTIVTHIRELADRMPVRFEVARGATSSTVTRVEV